MKNEMEELGTLGNRHSEMPAMKATEICVPKSALTIDGEEAPKDGEDVSIELTGKVRYAGEKAYITPATANGEPVGEDKAEAEMLAEDSDAALRKMGAEADGEY